MGNKASAAAGTPVGNVPDDRYERHKGNYNSIKTSSESIKPIAAYVDESLQLFVDAKRTLDKRLTNSPNMSNSHRETALSTKRTAETRIDNLIELINGRLLSDRISSIPGFKDLNSLAKSLPPDQKRILVDFLNVAKSHYRREINEAVSQTNKETRKAGRERNTLRAAGKKYERPAEKVAAIIAATNAEMAAAAKEGLGRGAGATAAAPSVTIPPARAPIHARVSAANLATLAALSGSPAAYAAAAAAKPAGSMGGRRRKTHKGRKNRKGSRKGNRRH